MAEPDGRREDRGSTVTLGTYRSTRIAERIGRRAMACPTPGIRYPPTPPSRVRLIASAMRARTGRPARISWTASGTAAANIPVASAAVARAGCGEHDGSDASRTPATSVRHQQRGEEAAEPATLRDRRPIPGAPSRADHSRSIRARVRRFRRRRWTPTRTASALANRTAAAMAIANSGTWESATPPRTSIRPGVSLGPPVASGRSIDHQRDARCEGIGARGRVVQ